jgi:hypothetical protein
MLFDIFLRTEIHKLKGPEHIEGFNGATSLIPAKTGRH